MNSRHRFSKIFLHLAFFCFVCVGTYNAVVINAESEISSENMRFVKRLDEVYGVETPGRMVAASTTWKKLSPEEYKRDPIVQVVQRIDSATSEVKSESESEPAVAAAIQEELNLNLTEVINPRKWQAPLASSDFSGNLITRDGVIESLNISLTGEESISVSFSEMKGNIFEYDINGQLYMGMIYQVDQGSYIITLTNGPLENTRLRFSDTSGVQEIVADEFVGGEEIIAGNFEESVDPEFVPDQLSRYDQAVQEEALNKQMYNFQ